MLTGPEVNILGNIIDTTWGKSSALEEQPASRGLKWQFIGEGQIIGTCSFIIHLSSYGNMEREREAAKNEATTIIDNALKDIKSEFKEEAGRSLKTEEQHVDDSIELFKSIPGPALFRLKVIVGVE